MKSYTIVRDTREQKGWDFSNENIIDKYLETGDYSLEGYENKLAIERKGSIVEFASNITQKRFERELERLEAYDHSFLILEFTLDDVFNFPNCCDIPFFLRKKLKIKPYFFLRRITEFQLKYKTKLIFAGDRGKEIAKSIFNRFVEENT
jgi:hypothetical protein